ncbi:hypothetical protein HELRODRAFT_183694 [Helobdella robusta]|uniref:Uncharacterized protein n=1 Tax=Helobdella robusta TaxID=6412 RepID=T1FK21_HELRO|nr:hypothetical protein HELRODRAFT_183694 [Helobdella robusta]ESO10371.1 hypothetical protein HELRODRAFT_183694 [Helobdella robusta]
MEFVQVEVPYETVVKKLNEDLIEHSSSLGLHGDRFECGEFSSIVNISVKDIKQELDEINSTPTCKPRDREDIQYIYKAQFEEAAMSYDWNEKNRTTAVVISLQGSAAEIALNLRYGEEHMKQIFPVAKSDAAISKVDTSKDASRTRIMVCQNSGIVKKEDIYDEIVNNALEAFIVVLVQQHGTNAVVLSLTFQSARQSSITDIKLRQICEKFSGQKMVLEHKDQDYSAPKCWNRREKKSTKF